MDWCGETWIFFYTDAVAGTITPSQEVCCSKNIFLFPFRTRQQSVLFINTLLQETLKILPGKIFGEEEAPLHSFPTDITFHFHSFSKLKMLPSWIIIACWEQQLLLQYRIRSWATGLLSVILSEKLKNGVSPPRLDNIWCHVPRFEYVTKFKKVSTFLPCC